MKRSRSYERLSACTKVERDPRFDLLDDPALKRAKNEVVREVEKRERCLLIRGGNMPYPRSAHLFCLVIDIRYMDECEAQQLEHWFQDWFGNMDVSNPSLDDCEIPYAFIAPNRCAVENEMKKMDEKTSRTSVVLLRWNQVFPVDELEIRLTSAELENGEKWSQNGLPSLIDILGVVSKRGEISVDEMLNVSEFQSKFYGSVCK